MNSHGIKQGGSTLIEVLVAMLVISVGLLGVAGTLSFSVKSNQSAYQRSQAAILAYDLADNMRASRPAAINGEFNDDCDPNTSLACQYRQAWDQRLAAEINAATATVAQAAGDAADITITVTWNDSRGAVTDGQGNGSADTSPENQTFLLDTRL
ncbi:MAG: type IV pilus modification protein PilV [Oceanospirillaceae bacterium]|uniref:type IV pilus modification protein PilV n=1 Tax=Marinobacterium litorale TaxID=404770 RepID=UPI00040EAC89|nr:type IV pilus modification protein PilV [Marinobacterium litorale]MBS99378.1 type IV pilus modification protein PilV [Oceanospirillaceae bacterium]